MYVPSNWCPLRAIDRYVPLMESFACTSNIQYNSGPFCPTGMHPMDLEPGGGLTGDSGPAQVNLGRPEPRQDYLYIHCPIEL